MLPCGAGCCLFACGPTGVGGAARAVLWTGLLGVPVGGGPPAIRPRRELRSARRLEARPGPATAHGHRSLALRTLRRLHAGGGGGFALHEALRERVAGVSDPRVVQFPPRLVVVRP